jgi:hypothetical protein
VLTDAFKTAFGSFFAALDGYSIGDLAQEASAKGIRR